MIQYSPSISKNVPKIVPNIRAAHFHKPSAQHRLSGLFLQRSVVDALKKSLKTYFCSKYFIECLEILLKTYSKIHYTYTSYFIKGGFKSEETGGFLLLQNKYSKSLS